MADFFNEDFWRGVVGNLIVGLLVVALISTTSVLIYRRALAGVRTRSDTIKFGFEIGVLLFLGIIALRLATLQTIPISNNDEKISTTLKEIQDEVGDIKKRDVERSRYVWPSLTNSQMEALNGLLNPITPKENYFVTCNDANCDALATQLSLALSNGQFIQSEPMRSTVQGIADGLVVLADDQDASAHKIHEVFQDVLGKRANVQFVPDSSMSQGDKHSVMIIVGVRR
jgi:hypothetical protein